ncbi:MAG: serpin family protein [Alphaproteobacteria bacterium]|nr:serpin family protein [Alphaproteobacteria bacterium]
MNNIKASLNLYLNSWKRSFDFNSKEIAEEYKNFINISLIILFISLISFCTTYEEQAFIVNGNFITTKIPFGIALFWCYMSFAFIPLSGLIVRRLHALNIDISLKNILKIFNLKLFRTLICIYFIPLAIISIINNDFTVLLFIIQPLFPYYLISIHPMYIAFVFLFSFCYHLFNTEKLKTYLEKNKRIHRLKKFLGILLLILVISIFVGAFYILNIPVKIVVIDILNILVIIGIFVSLLFFCITYFIHIIFAITVILFFSYVADIHIITIIFLLLYILMLALVAIYLYKKNTIYLYKKIKTYAPIYLPMIFVCIILPLNVVSPDFGSFGMIKNILTNANFVEQKVDSIGDKNINALSIPLLQTISKEAPNENTIISTHNLYQALSLMANGATGDTLTRLKQLLGSQNLDEINAKSKEILKNHSTALKFKNNLKILNKKHLSPNFKDTLKEYDIKTSFSKNNCTLELSSTLSFASVWKDKFGEHLTTHPFYTPTGKVDAEMMTDKREVYIAQGPNFRVLALPYKSGDNFYIILPSSKDTPIRSNSLINDSFAEEVDESQNQTISLDEIIEKLTPETFSSLKFEKHEISLMIPVFELSKDINLRKILTSLGLENLFKPGQSELNNILSNSATTNVCTKENIHITSAKQKNKIIVNEKGTAAVSLQSFVLDFATGAFMGRNAAPFIVDRPFIFMINNGAFIGIINDPTKKGDSF